MNIWTKIFCKTNGHADAELVARGEQLLFGIERVLPRDHASAMRLIDHRSELLEPLFDYGGPLHTRFATRVLQAIHRRRTREQNGQRELFYVDLPAMTIVTDLDAHKFGELLDLVEADTKPLLYLKFVRLCGEWKNVVPVLEAQYDFATDPRTILIFTGSDDLIVSKAFLRTAVGHLSRRTTIAGLPDQLADFAKTREGVEYDEDVVTAFGHPVFKFIQCRPQQN